MSPQSLLFSSDEETSRRLTQALQELELQVEHCTEIFDAVEKITTRSYDVIVADWDDGVEASFLLKTSRELKLNSGAFTLAIVNQPEANAAARLVGAMFVLGKPVVPEQAKLALLSCDDFLRAMRNWLPKLLPGGAAQGPNSESTRTQSVPGAAASSPFPQRPSARAAHRTNLVARPDHLVGLWPYVASPATGEGRSSHRTSGLLLTIALGLAFFSVGYVFSEPARGAAVAGSVTKICERALEKTHDWLQGPVEGRQSAPPEFAQADPPAKTLKRRIQVTPVYPYSEATANVIVKREPIKPSSETQTEASETTTAAVSIPDSLKAPIEASPTVRNAAVRVTPTLLGALEPVSVPEEFARRLLLQKVDPSYPEQALRTGLHGPVVLQAWISRDGSIRDLKLVRGSLLLGQAAYRAVKQWRYKPYLLNGQAVEAQTFVTVDFRLPQ